MAKYPQSYMISFYIGEGMSGVVPSLLGLSQGAGGDSCYQNISSNDTPPGPRFSVSVYFGILSSVVAISGIAFFFLNNLELSLKVRYDHVISSANNSPTRELESPSASVEAEPREITLSDIRVYDVFVNPTQPAHRSIKWKFIQLFLIIGIISALGNSVVPAILSYACLPYGPVTYHLATELSLLANPICCFLAFFVACKRSTILGGICSFSCLIAAVIIYTATLSPRPWLMGTTGGSLLIVLLCILWTGSISYIKVNVATILQEYGENALMFCGIITQLGSCCGAIIIFLVNTKTSSFKPC